jgi:Kelch motif protein
MDVVRRLIVTTGAFLLTAVACGENGTSKLVTRGDELGWRELAPAPSRRTEVAAAAADSLIYVMGGFADSEETVGTVEVYDTGTDAWGAGPPLPVPVNHPMATGFQSEPYIFGGYAGLLSLSVPASGSPDAAFVPPPGAPNCPVFPANNVWHADISALPVHPRNAAWIDAMGGPSVRVHPDFGPSGGAQPYGLPYIVVPGSHSKVTVAFDYADESDPGPYPFGPDTPIEAASSDAHALMIDRDTCILYELYTAHYAPGGSTAGSGAIFDLRSNGLRPAGWTSADAAGLPIFPGLIRRDEVDAGNIDHAIRLTAQHTDRRYLWPGRHHAGEADDPNLPPMGAWFRLKATFDISGFLPETQVILRAMKQHGLILADNGLDWHFGGASENGWSNDVLDELKSVRAGAFQAVDTSSMIVDPNSGEARIKAKANLIVRLAPKTISEGRTAKVRGSLQPPHPGERIFLQRFVQGRWRSVKSRALSAEGTFTFRVHPASTGSLTYRVRKPADVDHLTATSKKLVLTVV